LKNKVLEAVKQIVRIPKNHEIKIKVPQDVPETETIEVILIIKKRRDNFKQKIRELKKAVKDDLFLDDLKETSEDFRIIDLEGWKEIGKIEDFNLQEEIINSLSFQLGIFR